MDPMDPLANGPFWQARAKFRFATGLFNEAQAVFQAYQEQGVGVEHRVDPVSHIHRLILRADRLPIELPLLVGAGIHSLRSSLDTALSSLAHEAGAKESLRLNFPMHETEQGLRATFERGKRTCGHCKVIDTVKPYNNDISQYLPNLERLILEEIKPWRDANPLLWALNKIDNIQKHRTLIFVSSTTMSAGPNLHTAEGMSQQFCAWEVAAGEEFIIAQSRWQIISDPPTPLGVSLLFPNDDGFPVRNAPVFPVLAQLSKLVGGILITLHAHFQTGEPVPAS